MSLELVSPPSIEPVSIAEAKAHLKVETSVDDAIIGSFIVTSRLQIEAALSLAMIAQTWTWHLDAWPDPGVPLILPMQPVSALTAVRLRSVAGTSTDIPLDAFVLDGTGRPPRLALQPGSTALAPSRRVNGLEITFTAGFGPAPDDVPEPLRQAIKLLAAHWYEHREPNADTDAAGIPASISGLLMPWRPVRLS